MNGRLNNVKCDGEASYARDKLREWDENVTLKAITDPGLAVASAFEVLEMRLCRTASVVLRAWYNRALK